MFFPLKVSFGSSSGSLTWFSAVKCCPVALWVKTQNGKWPAEALQSARHLYIAPTAATTIVYLCLKNTLGLISNLVNKLCLLGLANVNITSLADVGLSLHFISNILVDVGVGVKAFGLFFLC